MYQVSFNSLLYFQRYVPGKLFTAKIKKGSNSINNGDRLIVLPICTSSHPSWPSISVSGFIKLPSIILEICSEQKTEGWLDGQTK